MRVSPPFMSTAFIAMGSNMGDRATAIHEALRHISGICNVLGTSFLYESQPMYHSSQPVFLNAACKIQTDLSPHQLLHSLKAIESKVGRQVTFPNGPRLIDLDIVLYGDQQVDEHDLQIPHPRMCERPFVLRPLCDLAADHLHPQLAVTMKTLHSHLGADDLRRVIPYYNHKKKRTRYLRLDSGRPLLMGIVNITPDSFSDGGRYSQSVGDAVQHACRLVAQGAHIIDIGGESTRPGAQEVSVQTELDRVLPVVLALRSAGEDCLISVDTRSAVVAAAAMQAGADIINDVSAATHDPAMLPLLASLRVPVVAMHMRGVPSTMLQSTFSSYADPLAEVGAELAQRLQAIDSVLPRWLQIADPGIGFAKGLAENSLLLQPENLHKLKETLGNRPLLVGLSRKRFLSRIHSNQSKRHNMLVSGFDGDDVQTDDKQEHELSQEEKDLLTAGANCAAVLGGADILRVHDIQATRLMLDAFVTIVTDSS